MECSADFPLCPQALLLCGCTTPDLSLSLSLVVSAQGLPSVPGHGAGLLRVLALLWHRVARCVSVGSPAEICGQKLLGCREREFSAKGVGWVGL